MARSTLSRPGLATSVIACLALLLTISQSLAFYIYSREKNKEVNLLRSQISGLQANFAGVAQNSRKAVKVELDSQMKPFLARAQQQLGTETFDQIKARNLVILDEQSTERIELGSEFFSHEAYLKIKDPSSNNVVSLSADEKMASLTMNDTAALKAFSNGAVLMFGDSNSTLRLMSGYADGISLHQINDAEGKPRTIWGASDSDNKAFWGLFNASHELVYGAQSNTEPFATTIVKTDPATTTWNALSAFSTAKTYVDIIMKIFR